MPIDKTGKKTGLAALEGLVTMLDKGYRVAKALFIVDKEHVTSFDEIKRKLGEHGFEIRGYSELGDKAGFLELDRGSNKVELYVVIAGDIKNMEEEVRKLASRVYGREVERLSARY